MPQLYGREASKIEGLEKFKKSLKGLTVIRILRDLVLMILSTFIEVPNNAFKQIQRPESYKCYANLFACNVT